jgi:hypothetical protein
MVSSPGLLCDQGGSCPRVKLALGEIYLLSTIVAGVGLVKLIRKNFLGCAAGGTIADKRLQMFELFKPGTMLWCTHVPSLLIKAL